LQAETYVATKNGLFGPSGVRALPLAGGRNIGGHYKWHFLSLSFSLSFSPAQILFNPNSYFFVSYNSAQSFRPGKERKKRKIIPKIVDTMFRCNAQGQHSDQIVS
jgi:hypothetical protein